MSAGTQAVMTGQRVSTQRMQDRPTLRAGYTSISTGTMNRLVAAVAADAFDVPLGAVRAGLHDDGGHLSLSLAVPLRVTADSPAKGGGTVFARAAAARELVARRVHTLAGTTVQRVDIRFTGIHDGHQGTAGRVR